MNAPLRHPEATCAKNAQVRFPRLSKAQKLLQAAADREAMKPIVAELSRNPLPPLPVNPDRSAFDAWRA